MSMAHQSLVAIIGRLVGIPAEQGCDFGLDSLRQKRSRTAEFISGAIMYDETIVRRVPAAAPS